MNRRSPIFDKTLNDYLRQVSNCDWTVASSLLGIELEKDHLVIPLFDQRYVVTAATLTDEAGNRPGHSICVLLCRYIIQCPQIPLDAGPLVTFKDFKDAAPFVGGFKDMAERPIAEHFSGRPGSLVGCCRMMGGMPYETDAACQLAFKLPALPRVPVYLMFNDADEEFAAQCTLLFEKQAERYLDMECLAIIGDLMASRLRRIDGETNT